MGRTIVTHSRKTESGRKAEFLLSRCTGPNRGKQRDNRDLDIVHCEQKEEARMAVAVSHFAFCPLLRCVDRRRSRSTRPTNSFTNSTFPHDPPSTLIPLISRLICILHHHHQQQRNLLSLHPSDFCSPSSQGNISYASSSPRSCLRSSLAASPLS